MRDYDFAGSDPDYVHEPPKTLHDRFLARFSEENVERIESVESWLYCRVRSIKFLYQRLTRGFDDSATWSLDDHLAKLILPRLKRFKELNTHAWPGGRGDPSDPATPEAWHGMLDQMIFAFEWHANDEKKYCSDYDEAEYQKVEEGLRLFAKYFGALWD